MATKKGHSTLILYHQAGSLAVTRIVSLWVEWEDSREKPTQDRLADWDNARYQQRPIVSRWLLHWHQVILGEITQNSGPPCCCLLYTSDAADDRYKV